MQKGISDGSDENKFRKINSVVETAITTMKEQTNGIIPALEILQVGYNEMKEHLNQTSSSLSATTIATDIFRGLESIEKLFRIDTVVGENEVNDPSDDKPKCFINARRRQLKKKAFQCVRPTRTQSPKKRTSMNYTSIVDDGEFLKIEKKTVFKSKKLNPLNDRQIKTVIKQLEMPM